MLSLPVTEGCGKGGGGGSKGEVGRDCLLENTQALVAHPLWARWKHSARASLSSSHQAFRVGAFLILHVRKARVETATPPGRCRLHTAVTELDPVLSPPEPTLPPCDLTADAEGETRRRRGSCAGLCLSSSFRSLGRVLYCCCQSSRGYRLSNCPVKCKIHSGMVLLF